MGANFFALRNVYKVKGGMAMDAEMYTALCGKELPAFYRVACSIVGCRADAEDAVQQAFLKAWKARGKVRPGAEKAWMMRIVINECYTILRKRRRLTPLEDLIYLPAPETSDTGLADAIRALPEPLRTPLLLKYMEGMTEKEVAAALHLSLTGVKNRLLRARRALKKLIDEEVAP